MSNKFYPKGAQKVLAGAINFSADTINAALVPSTYAFSAGHEYLSEIGALVGTAQTLTGKTVVAGVFDADDVAYTALAAGNTVQAVVLYKDTGNAGTSPLIAFFDEVTGFPFATNGGDLSIPWSNGPLKIISLV